MRLGSGKVAVVTGAASGIGLALCRRFAELGMAVVMVDVDRLRLPLAADLVAEDGDADVLPVVADVRSWDEVEALEAQVVDRFGSVQVLCNNAGVQLPGRTWEFTRQEWEWVLGVSLGGVVHGVHAFLPGMVARSEEAHVVNTASVAGLLAFPGLTPYTTAKFGIVGLSEGLRNDLREEGLPIGVSVLCPGPTESALRENSRLLRPGGPDGKPIGLVTDRRRTPADDIAAQVVEAVSEDRFWVLTHPEYAPQIDERHRGLLEGGHPVMPQVV